MFLALLSLCLAAQAPARPACEGARASASLPETPLPGPGERADGWCPPDFGPPPAPPAAPPEHAPAPASEPEPEPPALGAEPPPPPIPPGQQTWVDKTHAFFEAQLFAPVVRFDRFFSDEQELEEERSRSFLRWRSELRFDTDAKPAFSTGVRANLRFPGINQQLRRLRIVIEGQTREAIGAVLPDERDQGGGGRGLRNGDAELRFALFRAMRAKGDLGAGVLFTWPPGVFSRARLRWRFVPVDRIVTRASLSGFWRTDTRFGTSLDLHVERPFRVPRPMLLRLGSDLLLTQESQGVLWTPDVTLAISLGARAAAALGGGASWSSEPGPGLPRVDRYRLGLRLRRDFFRRWLFFELEPEVYWPWSPEHGRVAAWATMLRVEVQFHGVPPPRPPDGVPEEDDEDEVTRDVADSPPQR